MKHGRSLGRTGTTLLILALLGASAGGAGAQQRDTSRRARPGFGQGMRGMGEWWNNPQMVERLGLDEGTREQIDNEVYRTKRDAIELNASVQGERLELEHLLKTKGDLDLKEVEAQVDRLVKAQGAVQKNEIMLRATVMAYLTPDQRAELQQAHEGRRGRRPGRPGDAPDARRDAPDRP